MWRTDDNDQSFWVVSMLQQLTIVYTQHVKYTYTLLEGPTDSIHLSATQVSLFVGILRAVGIIPDALWVELSAPLLLLNGCPFFWKQWDVTNSLWSVLVLLGQGFLRVGGFQVGCAKQDAKVYAVFPVVLCFWQRIRTHILRHPIHVFFDKLCIPQHDEDSSLGVSAKFFKLLG